MDGLTLGLTVCEDWPCPSGMSYCVGPDPSEWDSPQQAHVYLLRPRFGCANGASQVVLCRGPMPASGVWILWPRRRGSRVGRGQLLPSIIAQGSLVEATKQSTMVTACAGSGSKWERPHCEPRSVTPSAGPGAAEQDQRPSRPAAACQLPASLRCRESLRAVCELGGTGTQGATGGE